MKGTDESLVPLMHHDPNDLRSQIRFWILRQKRILNNARKQGYFSPVLSELLDGKLKGKATHSTGYYIRASDISCSRGAAKFRYIREIPRNSQKHA